MGDPNGIHWTSAELQAYLIEALHVYNGITLTSRDRGSFPSVLGTTYYDLPTVLPTLRSYTVKDQDLVTLIDYHLLEPPTPTVWTGTAMFSLTTLTQTLQRRRDRFLHQTGHIITRETATVTPDANGRVALPTDVITLRRVVWTVGGVSTPAIREDEWSLNAFAPAWPTAAAPGLLSYSTGVTPPLTIQFAPPPNAQGSLDTLSVVLGAALNPATGVLLGVPDDYAWVIKWGALADLLSNAGPGPDPVRAGLAVQLWDLGIQSALKAAVVLAANVGGAPVQTTPLQGPDFFSPAWLASSGKPTTVLLAGQNLVALDPVPDGVYTVILDVVRDIPIPAALTDCYYTGGVAITSALLDYAQFLAFFKEGPDQALTAAKSLLQSFLTACGVSAALDQASTPSRRPILNQTHRDEQLVSRAVTPEEN